MVERVRQGERMTATTRTCRAEQPSDEAAIANVLTRAFGQPAEAELVAKIRAGDGFDNALSLVAVTIGNDHHPESIVGYILHSPIHIERDDGGRVAALSLAPMAVLPEYQNQGIGSQLVRAGLDAARTAGHRIVIVLGHENYYPRFGFERASACSVRCEWDVPDEVFMLLVLDKTAMSGVSGLARYRPELAQV